MSAVGRTLVRIALLGLAVAAAAPVRAEPWTPDGAVQAARAAARADRHQESIDAFHQAIELDPERRGEWLPELADQLAWSGQPGAAVPLYREAIANAAGPEQERRARLGLALALSWDGELAASLAEYDALIARDPADREARLGRARVLSWLDRQGPALTEYEAVLRDHPDDLEARRGVGRVQSWRGRHRDASRRMQELLATQPHDRQATAILAESLDWMGRGDRAETVLREQVAADPADSRSAELLDDIEFRQRPALRIDWRESHQSDDLRITSTSIDSRVYLADGRSFAGPRFGLGVFDPDDSPAKEILVIRPGFEAGNRFGDAFGWTGRFFVDVIETRGASGDHVLPTYDTSFSWMPNDLLRFDVGSSRSTFDNEQSLREGETAVYANASMDVTPDELTRFSTRLNWGEYSDGNQRGWWQVEAERRVWHHPRIATGVRYTGFDFARIEPSGYWNPHSYHANELLLRSFDSVGEKFHWYLGGTVGYEVQRPGSNKVIWSAGASLAYQIVRSLEAELAYDFFSSRTAASSGFERGTGRLTLRQTF
jgi:thioredoxin-like negative regulator of GroEL